MLHIIINERLLMNIIYSNLCNLCRCSCIDGYELTLNGSSCVDIDECSNAVCDHTCKNIPGMWMRSMESY